VTFLRERKGVSGVISGVFLVGVAVMVFNVLAWQFFQYDAYRQTTLERDQREWERFNERIVISETGYGTYLRFKVSNIGAVAAHIVEIWLNDTTTSTPRHYSLANHITSNCSAWIGSGAERWIYTTIPLTVCNTYDLRIATERGNTCIVLKFTPSGGGAPSGNQNVPFVFPFRYGDWQYSTAGTDTTPPSENDESWTAAWELSDGLGGTKGPWFRIKLRNAVGSDVRILSKSHINFVASSGSSAMQSKASSDVYTEVNIPSGEEVWVVFKKASLNNIPDNMVYYVFLAVFYRPINPTGEEQGTMVAVLSVFVY